MGPGAFGGHSKHTRNWSLIRIECWPFRSPVRISKRLPGNAVQILQGNGSFKAIKLQTCGPFDSRECLDSLSDREVFGALIPVADDHQLIITGTYALRQA